MPSSLDAAPRATYFLPLPVDKSGIVFRLHLRICASQSSLAASLILDTHTPTVVEFLRRRPLCWNFVQIVSAVIVIYLLTQAMLVYAATNAPSVRNARRTCCTAFVQTAAAISCHDRSGQPGCWHGTPPRPIA